MLPEEPTAIRAKPALTNSGAATTRRAAVTADGLLSPASTLAHSPRFPPISRTTLFLQLIRWNRPAGWLLLLWPTLSALVLASHGWPGWHLLVVFALGTVLMRSAGCCANDAADRNFDRHVARTADRPITSGALSVRTALLWGAGLALLAFALVLTTNALTVQWSFEALAIAIAYPFAKRVVSMPQAVLGIAFSIGIPMAFAAVQSQIPQTAWWLLAGNLFWVIAYDTEYAMVDRDDDRKIGIQTSALTLGRFDIAAIALCYVAHIAIWIVVLSSSNIWSAPVQVALGLAALQAFWHLWLIRQRGREACFKAFRLNHWIGFTVFVGVVLGYAAL